MTFAYTVTFDDLVEFNTRFATRRELMRPMMIAGSVLILIFSLVVGPIMGKAILGRTDIGFVVAIVIGVVGAAIYPWQVRRVTRWWVPRYLRRLYGNTPANDGVLGEHTLEFTADAVIERTSVNETRYTAASIHRLELTPRHVFLYMGPTLAFVVPYAEGHPSREPFVTEVRRLAPNV